MFCFGGGPLLEQQILKMKKYTTVEKTVTTIRPAASSCISTVLAFEKTTVRRMRITADGMSSCGRLGYILALGAFVM